MLLITLVLVMFVVTMLLPKLVRVSLRHSDVFLLGAWVVLCFPSLILFIVMEKITPLVALVYTLGAWLALAITECYSCELDADSLRRDLKTINLSYHADSKEERQFDTKSVMDYYRATTNRDYKILEWFFGPGMHTKLLSNCKLRQEAIIYWRLFNAKESWNVLELGCGKGWCTNWLAKELGRHNFWGVDLVKEQLDEAVKKDRGHFCRGDMSRLHETWPDELAQPFDAIFAIESACYMDTDEKMHGLAKSCGKLLKTGGTVTIIDGFRSNDFEEADPDQQLAMRMAEAGFRIRKMPSQLEWCAVMAQHGLVLKDGQDLTHYALPFWIKGWRVARFILKFPWLVCWYGNSSPERLETAANLLSVTTVAHAMRGCGAANYALLEFVKA